MNVFLSPDGTARIINPVPIYQGSNAVTDIVVQSFLPNTTAMELYFTMPDEAGTIAGPFVMSLDTPTGETNGLNYWRWTLLKSVTALTGTVRMTINAVSGAPADPVSGAQNTTSYSCAFEVQKGVLPSFPPFPPEQDQWALILQYMQAAFQAANVAIETVNPLQIRTKTETLPPDGQGFVNLQLIYNGTVIKEWSSAAQNWTYVNPEPTEPQPQIWRYNFLFGLPKGRDGVLVETDGMYGFEISESGDLILAYSGDTAPDMKIDEKGYLIYTF